MIIKPYLNYDGNLCADIGGTLLQITGKVIRVDPIQEVMVSPPGKKRKKKMYIVDLHTEFTINYEPYYRGTFANKDAAVAFRDGIIKIWLSQPKKNEKSQQKPTFTSTIMAN